MAGAGGVWLRPRGREGWERAVEVSLRNKPKVYLFLLLRISVFQLFCSYAIHFSYLKVINYFIGTCLGIQVVSVLTGCLNLVRSPPLSLSWKCQ